MKKLYVGLLLSLIFLPQTISASLRKKLKVISELQLNDAQIEEQEAIEQQLTDRYNALLLLSDLESEDVADQAILGIQETIDIINNDNLSSYRLQKQLFKYNYMLKMTYSWIENHEDTEEFTATKRDILNKFIIAICDAIVAIEAKME